MPGSSDGAAGLGGEGKVRWPETHGLVVQGATVGAEEPGTPADTQQVTQTFSPTIRVKAAPSNLGQRHPPTRLPLVKSPLPLDTGVIST